jgi:hypothetical protein
MRITGQRSYGTGGTGSLAYGPVVGGHHSHPRAGGGGGMNHRQILVDLSF